MARSLAQGVVDMAAVMEAREGATQVVDLAIRGMSCASCVGRVESPVGPYQLAAAIRGAGFTPASA